MTRLRAIQGDITQLTVDAIVNAANTSLLGGGGVDGAIHRAGGPAILEACRAIRARQGGCATGEAVVMTAGKLPARYVIHTVGPVWQDGQHGEIDLLTKAYVNSLIQAEALAVASVAFPNISTGVYRFPKAQAARVAMDAVRGYLQQHPDTALREIIFCCFDGENLALYQALGIPNEGLVISANPNQP